MARTLRLFVYGTLQPQAGTAMGAWIAARLVHSERATVPGRLRAVRGTTGWFPALLPAQGRRCVHGTVCTLRLTPADLRLLDRYEGPEYRRVAGVARSVAGRGLPVQFYVWRVAIPAASRAIADGDFLAWLRARRLGAFS